ncbi:MAG: hypothetical protein K2F72_04900, partial [Muribaculaceae bacterium]|nr:hypothetical protein [Muribaculaceae bacterium]
MKRILAALSSFVLPRVCPVCRRTLLPAETLMCTPCLAALPRSGMHLRPDANSLASRVSHPGMRPALAAAWIDYDRHSPYAALVRDAKLGSKPAISRESGRLFGLEMLADGCAPLLSDIDVLLPVPIHWTRLMQRGFNQSREVAAGLSLATGITVGDNLVATRSHRSQTRGTSGRRLRNVDGVAALRSPSELHGLHVAVVDDVVTTGATMRDAIRAVEQASPRAISVLALGAVRGDEWVFNKKQD